MLRTLLVGLGFLGGGLLALAIFGLCIVTFVRVVRLLPTDASTTSAWIGFAGSVVGALITVVVAAFALWPAYRQMGEMQKSSAVQAGQILRTRWRAAQAEINLLLKGASVVQSVPKHLSLSENDVDLEHWLVYHKDDDLPAIRDKILPELEAVAYDSFNVKAGVDLPDLDRAAFDISIQHIKIELYSILDGIIRAPNGGAHMGKMSGAQWRQKVHELCAYIDKDWPKAQTTYNNKINSALQILRFQIVASDRTAVGAENYEQFDQFQKLVDNPPN